MLFIGLLLGHVAAFIQNLRKSSVQTEIQELIISTRSVKNRVSDYMDAFRRTVRETGPDSSVWAPEEITARLTDLISDNEITAQLPYADTMEGWSSMPHAPARVHLRQHRRQSLLPEPGPAGQRLLWSTWRS